MKRPDGKKKHRGLHRGFEQLRALDDPLKTVEVIERLTGRKANFRALLDEFERKYGEEAVETATAPSEDMLRESTALQVMPIDLSTKFAAVQPSFLQMPHDYTDKIALILHPYGDIFYTKAWRESYGRGRRVFFRGGLQYMLRGTSLKSRRAVQTGRDALIENRLLIRITNDKAAYKGTLYRVVSPAEFLVGTLAEGMALQDIPLGGIPCKDPALAF